MIEATIIADSISPQGKRLTTFKLRYPKFIHGELMTHRVFSRNASSSRAIPVAKLIEEVRNDALRAGPEYWGAEQKGMASGEELSDDPIITNEVGGKGEEVIVHRFSPRRKAQNIYRASALAAASHAALLVELRVHKSIVNRLLEPFSHIRVVVTASEYMNFFGLRLDKAAQPEMRILAEKMWALYSEHKPFPLVSGQWHLPFIDGGDRVRIDEFLKAGVMPGPSRVPWRVNDEIEFNNGLLIRMSVARCARVSYESFDTQQRSTLEEDLALFERLVGAQPLHASPAEHQATPDEVIPTKLSDGSWAPSSLWVNPDQHGNFTGWRQYRKMLVGESLAPLPSQYK